MTSKGYEYLPMPLEKDEAEFWLLKAASGDPEAKNTLVLHNMRLVLHIVNRFKHSAIESEDLLSIGTIGLMKAIDKFDPTKKIQLSTFAGKCIENEILMWLRKNKRHEGIKSMDEIINVDKNGNELFVSDLLKSDQDSVEKEINQKTEVEFILKQLDTCTFKEKEIILYRFGINREEKKQAEIAKIMNISQSYISRIEKKVLEKLKADLKTYHTKSS